MKKWNWFGHMLRRGNESIAKQALKWTPNRQRGNRRPKIPRKETWRQRWKQKQHYVNSKYSWTNMETAAQDRAWWKRVVCDLCCANLHGTSRLIERNSRAVTWGGHDGAYARGGTSRALRGRNFRGMLKILGQEKKVGRFMDEALVLQCTV